HTAFLDCCLALRRRPRPHLLPYTTLFRSPGEWGKYVNTNLFGVFNCCHAALPAMVEAKKGRIVNIVSDSGRVGEPRQAVYSAAKDRKSTRLNSSHVKISYAVFCLKQTNLN